MQVEHIGRFGTLFVVGILAVVLGAGCDQAAPGSGTTPTGATADIVVGECEGSAYRSATDTGGTFEPSVTVDVSADGAVVVHFDDMSANCCPSPAATFDTHGSSVVLDFVDVSSETSCDCSCITDFVVTSEPLAAGEYEVEVVYDGEGQGTFPVTVP